MSLLVARSRYAAGLLAATALMLLLAATIGCAAWLHSQAVPTAAVDSLRASTSTEQQTIVISVVDRGNNDVAVVNDYLDAIQWPVSVDIEQVEVAQAANWPLAVWQIRPDLDQLAPAELPALINTVQRVESGDDLPHGARIESSLGDLLANTQRQGITIRSSASASS